MDPMTLALQSAFSALHDRREDLSYLHIIFQGIWSATHNWKWSSIFQKCSPREQHECLKEPDNKHDNSVLCP